MHIYVFPVCVCFLYVHMCLYVCARVCMLKEETNISDSILFSYSAFLGLNSSCQSWWQPSLSSKLSFCPEKNSF